MPGFGGAGLAGLSGVYGGMIGAEGDEATARAKKYAADTNPLSDAALWRGLQGLGIGGPQMQGMGGGMPPQMPGMQPQGQMPPQMPPQAPPPQGGPGMAGPPPPPQGAPPMPPQGPATFNQRFGAMNQPPAPPMPQRPPMPQGAPPMGGGGMPPQMPPQQQQPMGGQMQPLGGGMGGQGGGLTWQQIVQAIKQNNPPDTPPEVLAQAVTKATSIMNPASRLQWEEMSLQNKRDLETQRENFQTQLEGMRQGGRSGLEDQRQAGRMQLHPAAQAVQRLLENNPDATPTEIGDAVRAATEKPTATTQKIEDRRQAAEDVIDQIDEAIAAIDQSTKGGAPVTGMLGAGERLLEWGGNIAGVSDETSASDFQSKIRMIQMQIPRLITGTGRVASDERQHLEEIVRGLGRFTSPQQAKSSLKELKKTIERMKGGTGGAQPSGGSAKPKFDRAAAKKAGYTDQEIDKFLKGQ